MHSEHTNTHQQDYSVPLPMLLVVLSTYRVDNVDLYPSLSLSLSLSLRIKFLIVK